MTGIVVNVIGNHVSRNFEAGIVLLGTSGVLVEGNTASRDYEGIDVGGPGGAVVASSGNTIQANTATFERHDGILVESTSSANVLTLNVLRRNFHLQAEDLSSGGGTAGTANTWPGGVCLPVTSSPLGIC